MQYLQQNAIIFHSVKDVTSREQGLTESIKFSRIIPLYMYESSRIEEMSEIIQVQMKA
jgi:hypothetical protein